ncbi:hypothetical protein B0J18DRAFT_14700 [Chaetomium sp. MPI-SDFR-AT-0129]|nr:hypothetical protein B0J18DRAFT_14700 [Chaetomium sp. MPI-SDFR-AT-0129]
MRPHKAVKTQCLGNRLDTQQQRAEPCEGQNGTENMYIVHPVLNPGRLTLEVKGQLGPSSSPSSSSSSPSSQSTGETTHDLAGSKSKASKMCLIGLLIPAKPKKSKSRSSRKHRSRSRSPHRRRSERPRHEHSSRHRHDSSRHESSRRGTSSQEEKRPSPQDSSRDSAVVVEDALARLCLSLEQSLIEEQQRWRAQDRWERRAELSRLDHASGRRIPADEAVRQTQGQGQEQEEAPPYSLTDNNTKPARVPPPILTTTTPEPQPEQYQRGVADSPACRVQDSTSVSCCHNCVCPRCGSNVAKCPEVPELEHDSPARGAFSARHRAGLGE